MKDSFIKVHARVLSKPGGISVLEAIKQAVARQYTFRRLMTTLTHCFISLLFNILYPIGITMQTVLYNAISTCFVKFFNLKCVDGFLSELMCENCQTINQFIFVSETFSCNQLT